MENFDVHYFYKSPISMLLNTGNEKFCCHSYGRQYEVNENGEDCCIYVTG